MSRGFTLIEVVVALIVLEVAVVGAVGTMVLASMTFAEADQLERAVARAEGVYDSLMAIESPGAGRNEGPDGAVHWSVDPEGVLVLRAVDPNGEQRFEVRSRVSAP